MTNCKNASVSNEVALSVNRLVTKYGHELNSVTWTEVLETLATLLEHCQVRRHRISSLKKIMNNVILVCSNVSYN